MILHYRFHVTHWHKLARCNRSCRWGIRRNPKIELVKELKLQRSLEAELLEKTTTPNKELSPYKVNQGSESSLDKLVDEFEESFVSEMPCHNGTDSAPASVCFLGKKLLQFDQSHRPAYYGTWCRKRQVLFPGCDGICCICIFVKSLSYFYLH